MHAYLDHFLALELGRGKSRTRDCYYFAAKKIVDEIGEIQLKALSTELIARFFNEMKKKYAQSTLDKIYLVLKKSIKYALSKRIIYEDPLEYIVKPKTDIVNEVDDYKAYSQEELDTI